MPSSPFNVTWTVAITFCLLTLALATLSPEIVVASYNTGLTDGAFTAAALTSVAPNTPVTSIIKTRVKAQRIRLTFFFSCFMRSPSSFHVFFRYLYFSFHIIRIIILKKAGFFKSAPVLPHPPQARKCPTTSRHLSSLLFA